MASPTDAELQDLLRAFALIRGHEEKEAPDLVYSRLVATYTEYRVRDVSHGMALRVVGNRLFERYPSAPPLPIPAV